MYSALIFEIVYWLQSISAITVCWTILQCGEKNPRWWPEYHVLRLTFFFKFQQSISNRFILVIRQFHSKKLLIWKKIVFFVCLMSYVCVSVCLMTYVCVYICLMTYVCAYVCLMTYVCVYMFNDICMHVCMFNDIRMCSYV